jgi:hypothetical protein
MGMTRNIFVTIIFLVSLSFAAIGQAQSDAEPDAVSGASPEAPALDTSKELPVRLIPNIPAAGEGYYAPDDYHFIAQARDPDAQTNGDERIGGALTYIFTDDGKLVRRHDIQQTHLVQLTKPLPNNFVITAQYQGIRNESRIPVYDYSKNVWTLIVTWTY